MEMAENQKIDCHQCRHYHITWDKNLPHGCRAMKFKSKLIPSVVVVQSSGKDCLLFKRKQKIGPNRLFA
jgi:hypothetical protein